MLSKNLSDRVLTVGCEFRPPRGGIAQVLWNYEHYVFNDFRCVVNSRKGGSITKFFVMLKALVRMSVLLTLHHEIRIVHVHTASRNDFWRSTYFLYLAKIFGRKVILHVHGGGFREFYATAPQKISRRLRHADCIVVLTELWRRWFEGIVGDSHVVVIPNVIPEPMQTKNVHKDGRFHLFFLGLITQKKGIFDLLDVLAEHYKVFDGKLLLHVGGNGEVEQLKDFVEKRHLTDMVIYEGWVNERRKTELFALSDAFILPSYTEGLPMSILEAMSYGVPVIATRVGGIPELVADGEDGLLFEAGDRNALFSLLSAVLADSEKLKQMGKKSYRKVSVNYFPLPVIEKLSSVYTSLLNSEK